MEHNDEYTCPACGSTNLIEDEVLVCTACGWRNENPEYASDIDDENCDEDDEDFDNDEEDENDGEYWPLEDDDDF